MKSGRTTWFAGYSGGCPQKDDEYGRLTDS
jgi:hypothetical protein